MTRITLPNSPSPIHPAARSMNAVEVSRAMSEQGFAAIALSDLRGLAAGKVNIGGEEFVACMMVRNPAESLRLG